MTFALSILPIVLTLVCGFVLRQTGTLPKDQWAGIETLSFRLLIPVVLIKSIALSNLAFADFGAMSAALLATLAALGMAAFLARLLLGQTNLPNPAFTTLFQTSTRWNAFIALAAAELFIGPDAVAVIALSIAVLIPIINIANITVLAAYGRAQPSLRSTAVMVLKNPLVQACLIGLALKLTALPLPDFFVQTLDLIGRAALGVGILAVGAGIEPARLVKRYPALWLGVALRTFAAPALFLAIGSTLAISPLNLIAGTLVFAVPCATNGYIVAKQMGSDADLYADCLAWQTILSMLTIPALMALLMAA